MTNNIVTAVQEQLGLDAFDKIDPNQESQRFSSEHDSKTFCTGCGYRSFSGLYKHAGTKDATEELFSLKILNRFYGAF